MFLLCCSQVGLVSSLFWLISKTPKSVQPESTLNGAFLCLYRAMTCRLCLQGASREVKELGLLSFEVNFHMKRTLHTQPVTHRYHNVWHGVHQ